MCTHFNHHHICSVQSVYVSYKYFFFFTLSTWAGSLLLKQRMHSHNHGTILNAQQQNVKVNRHKTINNRNIQFFFSVDRLNLAVSHNARTTHRISGAGIALSERPDRMTPQNVMFSVCHVRLCVFLLLLLLCFIFMTPSTVCLCVPNATGQELARYSCKSTGIAYNTRTSSTAFISNNDINLNCMVMAINCVFVSLHCVQINRAHMQATACPSGRKHTLRSNAVSLVCRECVLGGQTNNKKKTHAPGKLKTNKSEISTQNEKRTTENERNKKQKKHYTLSSRYEKWRATTDSYHPSNPIGNQKERQVM